jgi:hypothetical protein
VCSITKIDPGYLEFLDVDSYAFGIPVKLINLTRATLKG